MKHLMKLLYFVVLAQAAACFASPGAHGPNGEHLDGQPGTSHAGAAPRVEAFSELFELVGQLSGGELSVLVDRYDSNQPVLHGALEVQYKQLKAQARFHDDIGDYAIDDAPLLRALSAPGKHALLFTFTADGDSDLLEGTLEVAATVQPPPARFDRRWLLLMLLPSMAAIFLLMRQPRRRAKRKS